MVCSLLRSRKEAKKILPLREVPYRIREPLACAPSHFNRKHLVQIVRILLSNGARLSMELNSPGCEYLELWKSFCAQCNGLHRASFGGQGMGVPFYFVPR
jgi:hypothetical protein